MKPMKIKIITQASNLVLMTLVVGLFAGCAATRPISDVALGAGGAYLGHELSHGDPLITANPALKNAYDTLVKDLPDDQKESVIAQIARSTRRAVARSQGQQQTRGEGVGV